MVLALRNTKKQVMLLQQSMLYQQILPHGVGTVGKLQFVDLAGSDLLSRRTSSSSSKSSSTTKSHMDALLTGVGNNTEWRFANKSLATMCDVVNARCQFARSVPYRNSTLTHLLRDSFEGDAKVLLVCCISSDIDDIQVNAMFKLLLSYVLSHYLKY